ncbi:MAG: hypothetical protein SOZ45_07905, partial [Ruminococcus sp.]|nr:hypothetical protein [Ruminococcus sp.]
VRFGLFLCCAGVHKEFKTRVTEFQKRRVPNCVFACRDSRFVRATGLNCVEYKSGARHTLSDYAEMAIFTAEKTVNRLSDLINH